MAEIRPKTGACLTRPESWKLFDADVVRWRSEISPDRKFIRDLLDLRRFVEPKAACFAAERATAEEFELIEAALAQMCAKDMTLEDSIRWDIEFHKRIVLSSGNQFIVQLVPVLEEALHFTIRLSLQEAGFNIPLHEALFTRMKARDIEGTERAALMLIQETSRLTEIVGVDGVQNNFNFQQPREDAFHDTP